MRAADAEGADVVLAVLPDEMGIGAAVDADCDNAEGGTATMGLRRGAFRSR